MNELEDKFTLEFKQIYKEHSYGMPYQRIGKVRKNYGMMYEIALARATIGSNVEFVTASGESCDGEIVGIRESSCLAMPYENLNGINSDTRVYLKDLTTTIKLSPHILGRVIDFQGNPIDGKGPVEGPFELRSIYNSPLNPLDRPTIKTVLDTGVHAINSFHVVGKGQRLAIMAGSGVGKSILLGMIARNTEADVNVIALVGERGREVLEFIQSDLGEVGLKKSVILVATSDTSPLIRVKAAFAATAIAEYFRDQNLDVLYMMDSLTRLAMAQREIGLSAGEPPGQKGYPPSVFAQLPKILERAGTKANSGTITGFYTVLVEGDDMDEPIADAIRAIADGHIILSRSLAAKNHYPAIDILSSISRVMHNVVSKEHRIVASYLKDLMATYASVEELINVGAYVKGSDEKVDKAIAVKKDIDQLLQQNIEDVSTIEEIYDRIVEIAQKAEESVNKDNEKETPRNENIRVI